MVSVRSLSLSLCYSGLHWGIASLSHYSSAHLYLSLPLQSLLPYNALTNINLQGKGGNFPLHSHLCKAQELLLHGREGESQARRLSPSSYSVFRLNGTLQEKGKGERACDVAERWSEKSYQHLFKNSRRISRRNDWLSAACLAVSRVVISQISNVFSYVICNFAVVGLDS